MSMKTMLTVLTVYLLLCLQQVQSKTTIPEKVSITVRINDGEQPDSVFLYFYDKSSSRFDPDLKFAQKTNDSHTYKFEIRGVKNPSHFGVFFEKSKGFPLFFMEHFLCEPGDEVTIKVKKDTSLMMGRGTAMNYYYYFPYNHNLPGQKTYKAALEFMGNGSAKYQCRYEGDKLAAKLDAPTLPVDNIGRLIDGDLNDSAKARILRTIEKYKGIISKSAYEVLKADAEANFEIARIELFKNFIWISHPASDIVFYKNLKESYLAKANKVNLAVSPLAKRFSFSFATYAAKYYYYLGAGIFAGEPSRVGNVIKIYDSIKLNYQGELKDKILVEYIKLSYPYILSQNEEGLKIIENARFAIKSKYYLNDLLSFLNANSSNVKAYNFDLENVEGNRIRLSDFAGKVVFLDFWYEGCSPCARYYQQIVSQVEKKFENNKNVVFVTISLDDNKVKWKRSIETGLYTGPSAINLYTDGKGYDHPVCRFYRVIAAPRPVLIGKKGVVASNNEKELRGSIESLTSAIEKALAEK